MPEPKALVTDTHPLIFHASGGRRLGAKAARHFSALREVRLSFTSHDLTPAQLYLADEARPNEDPFDALICAAARALKLPLITADADITAAELVRVVW
ncbi:MAG: PIN domain-containing protein [Deltaproteobacteria bacterium]|nr:PIN domain-containing protein [Deltaproteobacteria bacterium]